MYRHPPVHPTHRPVRRHRALRDRSGLAALEFGLQAPVWAALTVFALDFAEAFYLKMKLAAAVSAAAQFAFLNAPMATASTVTSFLANVETVAQTVANLSTAPTVTALFNNSNSSANSANYYCVSGSSPFVFSSTGTSSASCGGSVMSGKFVTITINGTMATFFASDPILGPTISASDNAVIRFE